MKKLLKIYLIIIIFLSCPLHAENLNKTISKDNGKNILSIPYVSRFDLRYTLYTGIISYQETATISASGFIPTKLKASTIGVGVGISDWVSIRQFIFGHEFFIFQGQTDASSSNADFSYFKRGAKTLGVIAGLGFFWTPKVDKGFSVGLVTDYLYKTTSWQLSAAQKSDSWSITPKTLGVFILSLEGKYQYESWKFYHKTGLSSGLKSLIWNIGVEHCL